MPKTTRPTSPREEFGAELESRRRKRGLSLRALEREVWNRLGAYTPSYETLRRLHSGEVEPAKADLLIVAALADIYDCKVSDFSAALVERYERARDLVVRQATCIAA